MTLTQTWRRGAWFTLPVVIWAAYATVHLWVCDDAFISFRYAAHLIAGQGLVFNPGEHVEGYTNFLWVLEVALLGWLGIGPEVASVGLSVLATIGTLCVTAELAKLTPTRAYGRWAALVAFWVLCTNRNFAVWTTSGLATRQLTFLILWSALLVRRAQQRPRWLLTASLALGAAALTRPEGVLLGGCVILYFLVDGLLLSKRATARDLLRLVLPFLAVVVVHTVWRRLYYDDWLPNTFHAKVLRAWPEAGIRYYAAAALESGMYLTVPLAVLGAIFRWRRRRDSYGLLTALLIVPHAVAFVFIGGDHFEFRPLDIYWPLLAVGVADGMAALRLGLRVQARRGGWPWTRTLSKYVAASILSVVLAYATILQVSQGLLELEHRNDQDFSHHIETRLDPAALPSGLWLPFVKIIAQACQENLDYLLPHALAVRWVEHHVFERKVKRLYGPYATSDRELLPPGTTMAHPWLGVLSYSLREVVVIDERGLTDRTVAESGHPRNAVRAMGHDREPPPGYLERRGVNVKVKPACRALGQALDTAPFAVRLAPSLWAPIWPVDAAWVRRTFSGRALYQINWESLDRSIVEGQPIRSVQLLLDCEVAPRDFVLQGLRCVDRLAPGQNEVRGQVGQRWLSSLGELRGDRAVGRAVSPLFQARRGAFLLMKLAGGSSMRLKVRLLEESGSELARFGGNDSEHLAAVAYDLSPHAPRRLRLEVVDGERGAGGHLHVDSIVVVDTMPRGQPTAPDPSRN